MIYEYRVYKATSLGNMPALLGMMEKCLPLFEKHGMKVVGCWTPEVGFRDNQFICLLQFGDMSQMETSWNDFMADPQWSEFNKETCKNKPIIAEESSHVMKSVLN